MDVYVHIEGADSPYKDSVNVAYGVNVDYGENGEVIGVEVLSAGSVEVDGAAVA